MASPQAPELRASGPREPPDAPSDDTPPAMAASHGRMGAQARGSVTHVDQGDAPVTDDVRAGGSVPHARDNATVTDPSSDDLMDVTERTRLAFENARARNPLLLPGPPRSTPRAPAAPRREISPVRNPYP